MLVLLLLLSIVKGQVSLYLYPVDSNTTVPYSCELNKQYIVCNCDCNKDNCLWAFNRGEIYSYLTFNKARFEAGDINKYGYWINGGNNGFKINYKDCDEETCYYPVISYLVDDDLPIILVVSCFTRL